MRLYGYGSGGAAAMRPLDGGVALPQAALRLLGVLWSVAASRLFAAVPLGRGYGVSSSVCVACGANRGGGSKTRRGLWPPRRQLLQLRCRLWVGGLTVFGIVKRFFRLFSPFWLR